MNLPAIPHLYSGQHGPFLATITSTGSWLTFLKTPNEFSDEAKILGHGKCFSPRVQTVHLEYYTFFVFLDVGTYSTESKGRRGRGGGRGGRR